MILIIDNYDSFTYNLYQYIGEFCRDVKVVRNDAVTLEEIQALKPAGIVISPGPGRPHEAGITLDVIRRFYKDIPILGICLGHQAMGEAFGGEVVQAKEIVHGKASEATLEGRSPLFRQLPGIGTAAGKHFPGCIFPSHCKKHMLLGDVFVMTRLGINPGTTERILQFPGKHQFLSSSIDSRRGNSRALAILVTLSTLASAIS